MDYHGKKVKAMSTKTFFRLHPYRLDKLKNSVYVRSRSKGKFYMGNIVQTFNTDNVEITFEQVITLLLLKKVWH